MNKIISRLVRFLRFSFSCDIGNLKKHMKNGCVFPHPTGIVISRAVEMGENCVIYQNVTIGAKTIASGDYNKKENYPKIGNNVIIYAGAVIVGSISIGDNCIVGANAFVNKSLPANTLAVGNPFVLIKKEID